MPMPARFSIDQLLDCALELFATGGLAAVSVARVAEQAGAPSGSVYHRVAGRDDLRARMWIRSVERFQVGYLQALADEDPQRAAEWAACHVLDWTRAHPTDGLLLLQHGAGDLLTVDVSAKVRERAALGRGRLEQAINDWRRRHPAAPTPGRARFALIDLPYAAVRPHLQAGQAIPAEANDLLRDALSGVLS